MGNRGPRPWCVVSAGKICARLQTEAAAKESAERMRIAVRRYGGTADAISVRYLPTDAHKALLRQSPSTEEGT